MHRQHTAFQILAQSAATLFTDTRVSYTYAFFLFGIISHCEIANPVKFAATETMRWKCVCMLFPFVQSKRNANDVFNRFGSNFFFLEY